MRRWKFIVFVAAVFLLPAGIRESGGRMDAFQSYAFPVLVSALFLLSYGRWLGIPRWVPLFAAFGWMSCLLYREIGINRIEPAPRLGITPADDDPLGIKARSLQRYSSLVAQAYDVIAPSMIEKVFPSSEAAYRWLRKRRDSRLLVVSRGENWDLVFGSGNARACERIAETCAEVRDLAASYDVDLPQEGIPVRPHSAATALILARRPELIHVAAQPVELTAHALVWMTAGLRKAADDSEESYAASEEALHEAGLILGPWNSIAPLAASSAILATVLLSHESLLGQPSPAVHQRAVAALLRARKLARRQYDPHLFAMVLNNLAVAYFFGAPSDDSEASARALLKEASAFVDEQKHPVLGARIAMMNLALLSGLIEGHTETNPVALLEKGAYATTSESRSS